MIWSKSWYFQQAFNAGNQSIKLHIYQLFWQSIPNLKSTGSLPICLCGSSHGFYVSSVITYTKDCGEKFQKVQKLIKSYLINS